MIFAARRALPGALWQMGPGLRPWSPLRWRALKNLLAIDTEGARIDVFFADAANDEVDDGENIPDR